ncbi:phage holin family protein [Sulfurospirillum cavolei]|uniref:phage holin family protein n=1 Tax=Sulfurospirillum cavolei TaxID=366522 RepID=UPI003FA1C9A8
MEKQSTALNLFLLPLASLLQFLEIDAQKLTILVVLMCIDMITGTFKAYRTKENITSRRWIAGFLSKLVVLLVPFTIALMAKGVDFEVKWFIGFSLSIMVIAEAYSILGNIYTFKTGEWVAEIDAVSAVIKVLRNFLENMIERGR